MSSVQDAIRLYSSSEDEETKCNDSMTVTEVLGYPLYIAEAETSSSLEVFSEEVDSEEEEKQSTPPAKRPRQEGIVTDISIVPTRAQQLQRQHQPKIKNTLWPSKRSRRRRYQALRAPVRQGNTVAFARVVPAVDIDGRSRENPQRHTGK